ncbi:IS200/IS605 family transposase [Calditrichota bacterium GD2]
MAKKSHIRCWLHILWGTKNHEKILTEKARHKLSTYFYNYAREKGIHMKINHVSPDHFHALVELPPKMTIEELFHLLKGSSSHWVNQNDIIPQKFAWNSENTAFSVSHSKLKTVENFIAKQEQLHWKMNFRQELNLLLQKHELLRLKT